MNQLIFDLFSQDEIGVAPALIGCRISESQIEEPAMPDQLTVKERITAVEQQLVELKRRLPSQQDGKSWVERIAGTFKDDPDFDEIVRLGREFRKSAK